MPGAKKGFLLVACFKYSKSKLIVSFEMKYISKSGKTSKTETLSQVDALFIKKARSFQTSSIGDIISNGVLYSLTQLHKFILCFPTVKYPHSIFS